MARCLEAVSVDKLEAFLVCSICLETLKDPRTLPCFHSYCKSCLEKFVKNLRDKSVGRQTKKFNCPNCRSQFTLHPGQEVADMTTNHFVCNMLDVVAVQDRVKGVPCSHCQGPSVGRCVTCEVFLCRECLTVHNKYRGFKDHSVLTMDELSEPENQGTIRGRLYCKEHSKKVLKFYCETCSELICRYCMDFNHVKSGHSCLPVEKVADKEKKLLASQCVTLAMELECDKKQFKAISDVKQSLERSKEQVTRDINSRKDTLLSAVTQQLNEEVERLMGKVEEIYNTKYGALTKQQQDLTGYVDKLEGRVNLFNRLLAKGTNEEILSSTKMIKENMETMQPQPETGRNLTPVGDGHIDYKYDTTDALSMPEIVSKMGKIKLHMDFEECEAENGNKQERQEVENEDQNPSENPGNGQQYQNPSKPLSFQISPKTTIFVYKGDITKENADAIVNPANERLQHDGGAAAAIVKIGGEEIQKESTTIVKKQGYIQVGDVAVTSGGQLPCKFIIHVVGPAWKDQPEASTRNLLRLACLNSLKAACKRKAKSISIPVISSGLFRIPVRICAQVLFGAVEEFLFTKSDSGITLEEIRFVNNDAPTVQVFAKELAKRYNTPPRESTQSNGNVDKSTDPLTSGTDDKEQMNAAHSNPEHVVSVTFAELVSRNQNPSDGKPNCTICLESIKDSVALAKCKHEFCRECIDAVFKHKQVCPICKTVYGKIIGNQPEGKMSVITNYDSLPGYKGIGTIVINYYFSSGIQGSNHPNPRSKYFGTNRTAYLPNNTKGNKVLGLLRKAFVQRLTFTIGTSASTNRPNQVIWNDIHHKTSTFGGSTNFGYPDPDYLRRVQDELRAKGIE